MIEKDRNIQIKQNIQNIILRATKIKQTLECMNQYVVYTQQTYYSFCKNAFKDLTLFQNKISKACRYQPEKTNMILRLSTLDREFRSKIERYAQINLNKLPLITKLQQVNKSQLQLKKKAQTFNSQIKNYNSSIMDHNQIYMDYISHCKNLDDIIQRFKSYSDPMKFYDKSITSQYQQKMQQSLNSSNIQQAKVTTELQLLDSKRKFLDQIIRQIRQIFTHLINQSLKLIQSTATLISDPGKDHLTPDQLQKSIRQPNQNQKNSEFYQAQFQRLNNFTNSIDEGNQILNDFNDIFKDYKGSKINDHALSDHKLFLMRCQSIKKKKVKTVEQCLLLHESLLQMFQQQVKSYKQFQKNLKQKQRQIFGIHGKESYKKDFESLFSTKSIKIHQLCMYIVQLPKKSFEQINVWITDNLMTFKQVVENKRDSLSKFNRFYEQITNQHIKQKNKFQSSKGMNDEAVHNYRSSIVSSLDQFRFIFRQLEHKQNQKNKVVTQKLILMYKFILKQYNLCKIKNILQDNRDKAQILRHFKIMAQAMNILKNDSLYNIMYEQFFGVSLQKSFQSKINRKQYEETSNILKQKQKIAKKMLKKQIGCCGLIKARPIQSQIISTHKCYIYNLQKNHPRGTLKICKEGLTFQDSKWSFFSQKVHILIPKSDIHSVETKSLSNCFINLGVSVFTQKGPLIFMSKNDDEDLLLALQKTYGQTYRKSMVAERKTLGRNDSTQSGGGRGTSLLVSYNKQNKNFNEQPVCLNVGLSKMSGQISMDKKLRGSNIYLSTISANSEQFKGVKPRKRSQSQMIEEGKIKNNYNNLILKYKKQNFWDDNFTYINKTYKSDERKDFQYKDLQNHNFFILKELKKHQTKETVNGIVLQISYEWKVTYPNTSLQSFKHGEKIFIDLNGSPPLITVVQWPHFKEQIFNRHFFYQRVKQMNNKVWKYIVKNMNQGFIFESAIQKQYCQIDDSQQKIADDIKQLCVSYPQQLQIKGSRICSLPINQNRRSTSLQKLELKTSNINYNKSLRKSSAFETGHGLLKPNQF